MTAKILYWNVERFNNNKIANAAPIADDDYMEEDDGGQGADRLELMLDTFRSGRNPNNTRFIPDFIVIVEVGKGEQLNGQGNIINGNPATGVIALLNAIRNDNTLRSNGRDWRLVPPLVLGYGGRGEGIAVFYNSTNWYFLGPQNRNANYLAPFDNALRTRQVPGNYGIVAYQGIHENQRQGQYSHRGRINENGNLIGNLRFPDPDNRPPWLTCFGSVGANPVLLRLMSFHSSPGTVNDRSPAINGTKAVTRIIDMMGNYTAARQIDVVLGDFNINNLDSNVWGQGGAFYGFVSGANPIYSPLLRANAGLDADYNSFYFTEAKQLNQASIEAFDQPDGNYPGYGYLHLSIDNAFFRTNMAAVNSRGTVVNRAVPTPYTLPIPPPVPAPDTGGLTYQDAFEESIANMLANPPQDESVNDWFREWANFGKMRSTSDHLPLIFEV